VSSFTKWDQDAYRRRVGVHDQASPPGPSGNSAISHPYSDYGPAGRSSENK